MSTIGDNYLEVKKRVEQAALRCGRDPKEITLVAVSKTKGVEEIRQAVEAGAHILGENKVQEIQAKYDELSGVEWHLIGHLQTNKVKYIVDKVKMIHSLDSLKLAQEIDKRCAAAGVAMDVLVEVNIGGEESKSGVAPELSLIHIFCAAIGAMLALSGNGMLTVGTLVAFLNLNKSFTQPITQISHQINSIVMAAAGAERVFNMMDEPCERDEGYIELADVKKNADGSISETQDKTKMRAWKIPEGNKTSCTELKGNIAFNKVDFGYDARKTILHGVTPVSYTHLPHG